MSQKNPSSEPAASGSTRKKRRLNKSQDVNSKYSTDKNAVPFQQEVS